MKKRILGILLSALLVVSLLPTAALAETSTDCPGGEACTHAAAITSGGTATHCDTLEEAVAAATDGAEIRLLKDCSGAGIFTASTLGTITIDFGGHTYTCEGPAVGSVGTKSQAFHLENTATVLKNGTITSTAGNNVKMLVQNYSDLSLENITLDGTKLDKNNVGFYTLSNNRGGITTRIGSGVKIIAHASEPDEPGLVGAAYAFDADKGSTVVVEPGAEIEGKIAVTGGSVLTVNGGAFTDFATAFANAANNAEIKLLSSVAADATITVPEGKSITIDLNGKTISGSSSFADGYLLNNNGTLTLKNGTVSDSRTNASGTITAVRNMGTLNVADMTVSRGGGIAIKNDEDGVGRYGTLIVTNSNVSAQNGTDAAGQAIQNWGSVRINSGTFDGAVNTWSHPGWNPGNTTINGGTFNGAVQSLQYSSDGTVWPDVAAATNINGGEFKGAVAVRYQKGAQQLTENTPKPEGAVAGVISVSGGKFANDPGAYVRSGYSVKIDPSGLYVVAPPVYVPGGGGGGGTSAPSAETVEIPAIGNGNGSVQVEATLSGSTAAVSEISSSEIGNLGTDAFTVDFSGLGRSVDEVRFTAETVDNIADSESSGLEIRLSTGTVEFDKAAVEAISEEADGNDIVLNVEEAGANTLFSAQQSALEKLDNPIVVKVTLSSGGNAISDFGAGSVTITVSYEKRNAENVVLVYYLDNSGRMTKMSSEYDEEAESVTFKTSHFSEYVIAEAVAMPFADVAENAYYADAARWAVTEGITAGTDEDHFSPAGIVSRAQVVTFLWRAAGRPEPSGLSSFSDVAADAYYAKAVAWAVEKGITEGVGNGRFAPDEYCSRVQIVTLMYRYGGKEAININRNPFSDIKTGEYYSDAVLWAVEKRITDGTSATTFSPASNCPRAQVVTFLYRYMGK